MSDCYSARESMRASALTLAISRLGLPLSIFGVALLLLTLALRLLLSPDRFPVRIGDKVVRLSELTQEEARLRAKHAELLRTRAVLFDEKSAPILLRTEKLRASALPLGPTLLRIDDLRRSFNSLGREPLSLPRIEFDRTTATLTLEGEMRDSGGRSIPLLASFVDALRKIPLLSSVSEPEYTHATDIQGLTYAPFTLHLRFHPSDGSSI